MSVPRETRILAASLLVVLFGYFLHQSRFLALICLSAFFLSLVPWLWRTGYDGLTETLGLRACHPIWIIAGVLDGILLGMLLRWSNDENLILSHIGSFILIAASIGMSEELIFRGYILGRIQESYGTGTSITLSSLLHTAYKLAIFIPFSAIPLIHLGSITFVAGLVLGYTRIFTKSIWYSLVFHAVFDLWAYGDKATPWWVW